MSKTNKLFDFFIGLQPWAHIEPKRKKV
ncbi:unnamed protein product [Spirodela intermedia]|uniref:Uncharacterized protein n=1 Tax=Spirodela intermedia TaxID=51605 RepID=A0A7I8IG51_SPIIN|nr:unnamed protein product [Spirodela intermedia]CAA6656872.1 unnamed protein product [Spirodela intermedia]